MKFEDFRFMRMKYRRAKQKEILFHYIWNQIENWVQDTLAEFGCNIEFGLWGGAE